MHALTGCLGISVGFHRLLAHRAFHVRPIVRDLLATLSTLALQGGPLCWVAIHRAHHRHSDSPGDPHARTRGFLFSLVGWALLKAPNGFRFRHLDKQVADLARIPWLVRLEKQQAALNLAAFALGVALLGWEVALWAFPLRIVATWATQEPFRYRRHEPEKTLLYRTLAKEWESWHAERPADTSRWPLPEYVRGSACAASITPSATKAKKLI